MKHEGLSCAFQQADARLLELEARLAGKEALPLAATVEQAIAMVRSLIVAYLAEEGRKMLPPQDADLLDVFKVLVKGDPSWNALRDNCRELVYYRNCIAADRLDALPLAPEKMAVRTARHIYLYLKTRFATMA
ncbi:MAG: hypothetical protein AB1513_05590 [Pseudomonadota bacterium]